MNIEREIVATRSAWLGQELQGADEWIYRLGDEEVAEIDAALRHLKASGRQIPHAGRADFPLERFGPTLRLLRTEVEYGLGFMLIRGMSRDRYSAEDMGLIFWGIGAHLGRARAQNAQGDMLGHVRDMGRDMKKDMHARGYQTASLLPFHNDSCDVVGLCCLEVARRGGQSVLASSLAVYNELVRTRPDLAQVLCESFCVDRRGEEATGQKPYYVTPIFVWHQGRMFNRYNRLYIESAQRHDDVPRLSKLQIEALDAMDRLCADRRFFVAMNLERADMQFVNNYVVLHSRTAYEDEANESRKRHLLRLWLSSSAFADCPKALLDRYEDMDRWQADPRPPSYSFIDMAEATTN